MFRSNTLYLRVTAEGQVVGVYPLNKNHKETFISSLGSNVLIIKNGIAYIESADCPNQICVHSIGIDSPGETIACLPHQLLLEVCTNDLQN